MKMNRKLMLILAVVLSVAMAAGGTMAYLQDTDEDVNVMTLGNVYINQLEYERVPTEGHELTNDKWETTGEKDKYGYTPDEVRPFTQGKPLYPAVFTDGRIKWDDRNGSEEAAGEGSHQQSWADVKGEKTTGAPGSYQLFDDSVKNVIDKFVFVENTGNSDAYVRTWIALEQGSVKAENFKKVIMTNTDADHWDWETVATDVEIADTNDVTSTYYVLLATYKGPTSNPTGILAPGAISYVSLAQVYMKPEATNDDVIAIDGNQNGTYDILVFSQAVQAEGFTDAKTALDEAFGGVENIDLTDENNPIPWKLTKLADNRPDFEAALSNTEHWDGTVDISWYNETDTEFVLTTAEQLAGLAELVDGGNTFEDKTIKLGIDMCFGCGQDGCSTEKSFNPIGHSSNGKSFNGTFDGQDHTLSKLYMQSNLDQNNGGWLYEGEYYGLFAYTNGATIKNVTIEDAYISSGRNEAAGVVGNAVDTAFSDITISKSTLIGYNNSVGGVAAECYGNCSFTNITVDKETVLGPLWGTYDVRLGGIVGMVQSGNKVSFSNVDVSCKLDAINDVAANYQYWLYRYCGMLIGQVDSVNGVADPTGYVTCEDVTVTYGDWVNYHYCEFARLGAGSYNGPGEYKYARVEAGTGTDGIDLSACNHSADESHNVLIVFNQLFGGGQGVKGLETYDGVTVIDNNK